LISWRVFLLTTVIAIAPWARAEAPIFDIQPELELADLRLEMAQNPPPKFRKAVEQNLAVLHKDWARNATDCADPRSAPAQLIYTKAYMQSILRRLTEGSQIPASLLKTDYGVCTSPAEHSGGGISPPQTKVPRISSGVILMPPKFFFELKREDELAFVLAHELSHFLLKHEIMYEYLRATKRSLDSFTIAAEREADELAMRMIINAGYDIDKALATLIELRSQKGQEHYLGEQMQDLRNIVMADLKEAKKVYSPRVSEEYMPPAVREELQRHLRQMSAGL
jgi:hypothetical protein